jgi:hypothetical protein
MKTISVVLSSFMTTKFDGKTSLKRFDGCADYYLFKEPSFFIYYTASDFHAMVDE